MKKATLVTIGLLLSLGIFAQAPFNVDRKVCISGNDTTEIRTVITNIGFKLYPRKDYIKVIMENRPYKVTVKTKKLFIIDYVNTGDDVFGLTIIKCENESLGYVVAEMELETMSGIVKIDRDRDGEFEEVFILKN